MKIIKEGKLPEEQICRGKCRNCSTEVEYKAGEAKHTSCQRDGDFYTVTCPICKNSIHGYLVKN